MTHLVKLVSDLNKDFHRALEAEAEKEMSVTTVVVDLEKE